MDVSGQLHAPGCFILSTENAKFYERENLSLSFLRNGRIFE
jgi:hypothetical protein